MTGIVKKVLFFDLLKKMLLFDLLRGMLITLKTMFTHPVTRRYPKEKRDPFDGFRGRHAFVRDPETGTYRCVACTKCATVCPPQCIHIEYSVDAETGRRILTKYEIDAFRCIFCGYCEEVCPVCAIVLTEFYEYAAFDRKTNYFDIESLLRNWDEFVAGYGDREYANKFWKPEGIDLKRLPVKKRTVTPVKLNKEDKNVYSGAR